MAIVPTTPTGMVLRAATDTLPPTPSVRMPHTRRFSPAWVALIACTLSAQKPPPPLGIGSEAPKLEVSAWVRGEPLQLGDGKVAVVEFMATWCPASKMSLPLLNRLQRSYEPQGVHVVAIATSRFDAGQANVESFAHDWGARMSFALAWDGKQAAARAWLDAAGETSYPVAFVVDAKGRVAWIGGPLEGLADSLPRVLSPSFDIEVARQASVLERDLGKAKAKRDRAAVLALANTWLELEPARARPWIEKFKVLASDLSDTQAAIACAREALTALAANSRELGRFANDGLFAERQAVECHALGLEALAAAHATDQDDTDLGLAYFMALAATGREEEAGKVAEATVESAAADAHMLCSLAQDLTQPRFRGRYAPQALLAARRAGKVEPADPQIDLIEFKILTLVSGDLPAANAVGVRLVGNARTDVHLLNAFAWDLLDSFSFAGRFNELALLAAETVHAQEGGQSWMFIDTLARAKFVNGHVKEAVELQQRAVDECDHIGYAGDVRKRLMEYRAALRRRD